MSGFKEILLFSMGNQLVLQGNQAFALGVLHAGYTCAEGYPGTPSTEVIDALLQVPEQITAGWSVNEAVALGVGVGCAVAGKDAVVTMKVPGLFQAADVLVSSAFAGMCTGALVLYVATDNEFSSSQYAVDVRPFLKSIYLPVLEPRSHQELYEVARTAADLSRAACCPVVILTSSILAHSESAIIVTKSRGKQVQSQYAGKPIDVIPLPSFARRSYTHVVLHRMDLVKAALAERGYLSTTKGTEGWGIITVGVTDLLVRDCLQSSSWNPSLLAISLVNPLAIDTIKQFVASCNGDCYIFEESGQFVEQQLLLAGISVIGKRTVPTTTQWTPQTIHTFLATQGESLSVRLNLDSTHPVQRIPAICSGCPYRAFANVVVQLKQEGSITRVFGDIGCSSLLSYEGVFDFSLCMGASDSLRQGYVLAHPEEATRVVSLIGDSSECHSGMDASRNSMFRSIPGVKVILDNEAVAMTGHQKTPTSHPAKGMSFKRALEGENIHCIEVDAYQQLKIDCALRRALAMVKEGGFTVIIIKGACLHTQQRRETHVIEINAELCMQCGSCNVCPSIVFDDRLTPSVRAECSLCGQGTPLCVQACPFEAIAVVERQQPKKEYTGIGGTVPEISGVIKPGNAVFKGAFRLGVRGVGGQGNLFMGKYLAQVVQHYFKSFGNIYKGEVHGMAQKGGAVVSTFAFGKVYSPIPQVKSLDILISLERTELFRNHSLSLLKPDGLILLSDRAIIPRGMPSSSYPTIDTVLAQCFDFNVQLIAIPPEFVLQENVFMAGVLSQQLPLAAVPLELWLSVLRIISRKEELFASNAVAFIAGKNFTGKLIPSGKDTVLFLDVVQQNRLDNKKNRRKQ